MSSSRFFVQLPVQSPGGTVMRQYYDCMPIVFICHEEKYASEVASTVSSALSSWNIGAEHDWKDEELRKLDADPTLNGIRPRKLYAFMRPETGQKTITTDYRRDILPLLGTPHNDHIPLRRVETLAQALVFMMAKGDTHKLRSLGLEWAERRSSPRSQLDRKPGAADACVPVLQHNSASASVPGSARGELPSGRKAPCCTKCREPMKGHSKPRCQKLTSSSLEAAIGQLSLDDGRNQTGDQPPLTDPTSSSSDQAHCFILSSKDIERVDATIVARGLKSRTVNLTEAESGEVAYIVARSTGPLEALATEVIKINGRVNVSWLRVSSAAAIGAITAWAGLAYL